MTVLQAILLGIVQGSTEFLPVSSSGHLALFENLLGKQVPLAFDVLLHFASLAAIVLVLWADLWSLLSARRRLILPLIVGTIPAGLAGYYLERYFDTAKNDMLIVGASFIITGVILALGERLSWKKQKKELQGVGMLDAIVIGCAQAVALLPGVSRSGMTISSGLTRGLSRPDCVRFSFLLAMPVMAGACVLKAPEILRMSAGADVVPLVIAASTSFLFSAIAMILLLRIVRKVAVSVFSYYCVPLGMLLFIINAGAPVSLWIGGWLHLSATVSRIVAGAMIAVFAAAVIRLVFFGLMKRTQAGLQTGR